MATAKTKSTTRKSRPRGYNFAAMGTNKIVVGIISAVGQADVKAFSMPVGFPFKITKVETYARAVAAVITAQVKIGANSVLAANAAFVAGATTNAPLVGGAAKNRGGKATDSINVHFTTDGAGAVTNGHVIVTVEPT
jgi:hypothetical protein